MIRTRVAVALAGLIGMAASVHAQSTAAPTFTKDVAPILYQNCTSCHRAGEIGPMQFLPASYDKYAVDFDGDGRRDLFRSIPDMLASTANFLKGHGWQAGQPWGEGTPNFAVIREWNKAEVYVKTIALMGQKLAQAAPERRVEKAR